MAAERAGRGTSCRGAARRGVGGTRRRLRSSAVISLLSAVVSLQLSFAECCRAERRPRAFTGAVCGCSLLVKPMAPLGGLMKMMYGTFYPGAFVMVEQHWLLEAGTCVAFVCIVCPLSRSVIALLSVLV